MKRAKAFRKNFIFLHQEQIRRAATFKEEARLKGNQQRTTSIQKHGVYPQEGVIHITIVIRAGRM